MFFQLARQHRERHPDRQEVEPEWGEGEIKTAVFTVFIEDANSAVVSGEQIKQK